MPETAFVECAKCGAKIPLDSEKSRNNEDGVLTVRYDPHNTQKIVLLDSVSGARHEFDLSGEKPASRQIGGIIGPY
ncbi:MAG: hypothetical protein ACRD2U_08985 [Terriglobales bacterium]